jgi:hypothetical protein
MKTAKADITPIRQRTQYTCMGASLSMALGAQGVDADEDTVNKVMGCKPMQGASWEQAIGAAQHFGMRATLVSPCALSQLKDWTDRGVAVMIAWNPEGRDWSHASCVFDVDDDGNIHIADPNIPDPDQTVRVVPKDEFFKKWFEKWPNYLVRRPALAIEREITKDGRQILASALKVAEAYDCYQDYKAGGLSWEEYQDCLKSFGEEEDEPRGYQRRYPVRPSYQRPPAPVHAPASLSPGEARKIEVLDMLLKKRPGDGFLKSIREQVARGKPLSEAQLKAIRQNLYRSSMRPEADHFRMAARIVSKLLGR